MATLPSKCSRVSTALMTPGRSPIVICIHGGCPRQSRGGCARWCRFVTPGRPPIVICNQCVLPVRVADGAVRVRDGSAVGIHRQRVVRVGDGAAVAICSQDVAPCHVRCVMSGHVASCHVMSCQVTSCHIVSCHVTSRHVKSCHIISCQVVSRPVLSRCVVSRREKLPQHIDAATSFSHSANARRSPLTQLTFTYHPRPHSLHSHHSHSCVRVVLSTSHSA